MEPARREIPSLPWGGRDLRLYKFDACPYCRRVMDFLDRRGLVVEMADTRLDPQARSELRRIGGKSQVPCLVVDGRPLYESEDIIRWFEAELAAASGA